MADKTDIWQEWTEKVVRYVLGKEKTRTIRLTKEQTNLRQEWFGQLPNAFEFLWRKWFKK
ncbi:MAG: hypothetical protein RLZZ267_1122 [Bacillota bacterium]|jgi:hypothetical protein